ncbi:MAG TPA: hypothetical protein VE944_03850 [Nostoc sp.]|nr:hypothetical protein [Nostoc sp.]HYX13497.1 hypothetical protein [Nostoc sp.]
MSTTGYAYALQKTSKIKRLPVVEGCAIAFQKTSKTMRSYFLLQLA